MMPHATVPRAKWPIHPNGRGKVMPVRRSATCTISSIGLSCGNKPTELLAIIKIDRTMVAMKPAISPAWTFRVTGIACKNYLRFMALPHELENPSASAEGFRTKVDVRIRSPAVGITAAIGSGPRRTHQAGQRSQATDQVSFVRSSLLVAL